MKILTFATRLKMKAYIGQKAHRWVQEEIFNKVQDIGSLYPIKLRDDIDGYIEDQ